MGLFDWLRGRKKEVTGTAGAVEGATPADPREELRREVEAVLRARPEVTSVEPAPEGYGFSIKRGEQEHSIYLDNLFAETRELPPEERRLRILHFLSILDETGTVDWEEAQPMLRLVLRACTANTLVTPDGKIASPLARPFLPFLSTMVVVDAPTSMQYVGQPQLEEWGVGADEVFAAAGRNLDRFTAEAELYDERHGPLLTLPEDDYAASQLLVPGWLAGFAGRVEGRPLAIVPERSTVFVGGDANPELVQSLAERAQREFLAANRSVSPAVYTVDEAGSVIPFVPEGATPLARLVRRGHAILGAREYAEQKGVLEAFHERHEIDLFVAELKLVGLEGGRTVSYCVWPDGVEGLLPRADLAAVCGGEPETPGAWHAMVPFGQALEIGKGRWTRGEVAFGPERIRIGGDFSPEQIEAFKKAAVTPEDVAA